MILCVRFEFMIAEDFPADDPIAQFVTIAAMISCQDRPGTISTLS
jgi:hypothetical protein